VRQRPRAKQEIQKAFQIPYAKDKTILFQGNGFTLNQLEDWEDKTLYTLLGRVTDSSQLNVIITHDKLLRLKSPN
jgi:hypothetical protein